MCARTGLWEPRVGNCPGPPGRHDEALKTLSKLDVTATRALDPEIAARADLLGRDLAVFHELATSENVKLPPPDDLGALFTNIGEQIASNNLDGAQTLLTRFKEGVERARQELKDVRTELDAFGAPPDSLKSSHEAVGAALDDGDSVAARIAVDSYANQHQNTANEIFQTLESLGAPPFDLIAQHAAVLNDLENDNLAQAETGLAAYRKDFTAHQKQRTAMRRELVAMGKAPPDLAVKRSAVAEALEKGKLEGVRADLNDYKKDLQLLAGLRQDHAELGKPPANLKDQYAAILPLIDRGALDDAGSALATYRKAVVELNRLADEFHGMGMLFEVLAEQHMKVDALLEAGDVEEARKNEKGINSTALRSP
jgi:hypothetical protein